MFSIFVYFFVLLQAFERRWAILEGDVLLYYAQKVGNRELNTQKVRNIADAVVELSGIYVTSHNKRCFMSIFERYEISALSKDQSNKLINDTKLIQIDPLLLKI